MPSHDGTYEQLVGLLATACIIRSGYADDGELEPESARTSYFSYVDNPLVAFLYSVFRVGVASNAKEAVPFFGAFTERRGKAPFRKRLAR